MSPRPPMSHDEFLTGVSDMLSDFADPDSDISQIVSKVEELGNDVAVHDVKLAALLLDVGRALVALKNHAETTWGDELKKRDLDNSMSDQ